VINNLIFNAFKYTNSWTIEIKLDETSFSIKDSWIWISKENLPKIWTRFYKEDKSRTDTESHWLWLALVKDIVKKHKFKINVKSTEWEWSKFTIHF
jgi:signal transduction histidine kinase